MEAKSSITESYRITNLYNAFQNFIFKTLDINVIYMDMWKI